MSESAVQSREAALPRRKRSSETLTLTLLSSATLPAALTSAEKDSSTYWNAQCAVMSSMLWLPHKTALPVRDSNLSDTLSNYQADKSQHWMTRLTPLSRSIQTPLSVSLPASATVTTVGEAQSAVVKATKKIRFFPHDEEKYRQALFLYRRAYNLTAERYREGTHRDEKGELINLRPWIKSICKPEQKGAGRVYNSLICDNAVREATKTFVAVCKKNKQLSKGNAPAQMHFKTRRGEAHSFRMCRLPAGLCPAVKALGKITLTESVPQEAVDQSVTVTCNKGRWFINVQHRIRLKSEKQGVAKCVSVDPGVRTFATCYSPSEVIVAGDNIAKEKLFPLMKKVDNLLSQRQRILNQCKGIKFPDMPQWARDRLTFIDKTICRLKCKKEDIVRDLHQRLAHYLTEEYDVIFLPHFQTRGMVKRTKGRVLRRNTCRQMLSLEHYAFKLRLKWLAKKKGKLVLDTNESHTSKTVSHTGRVIENLGGRKIIHDENKRIDRDINGARGIFIKTLSQAT